MGLKETLVSDTQHRKAASCTVTTQIVVIWEDVLLSQDEGSFVLIRAS